MAKSKPQDAPETMDSISEAEMAPPAPPAPAPVPDKADFADMQRSTKAILDAEPKVRIRIPQAPKGSPQLGDETVCLNGVIYLFQRGHYVEVPVSVAKILENARLI